MDKDDKDMKEPQLTPDANQFYITVRTAQEAPGWLPWAIYAMLAVSGYMFHTQGSYWWLTPIMVVAVVCTHVFFDTYNALTRIYNDVRIREAVERVQYSVEKELKARAEAAPQAVHQGVKLLGTNDTKIEPGVPSSEAVTLTRYSKALTWINLQAKTIGDARDRAWKALEHDQMESRRANDSGGVTKKD